MKRWSVCCKRRTTHPAWASCSRGALSAFATGSAACAIQNMWLAARAEGLGMGWVSVFDPAALGALLQLPEGSRPIALLCLGPVPGYYPQPMLAEAGWAKRLPLRDMCMDEVWQAG